MPNLEALRSVSDLHPEERVVLPWYILSWDFQCLASPIVHDVEGRISSFHQTAWNNKAEDTDWSGNLQPTDSNLFDWILEKILHRQSLLLDIVTLIFVSIYGLGRDCSSNWKRRDESRLYLSLQKKAGVMIFVVCSANGICGSVFAWFWWIFVVCSACLCTSSVEQPFLQMYFSVGCCSACLAEWTVAIGSLLTVSRWSLILCMPRAAFMEDHICLEDGT